MKQVSEHEALDRILKYLVDNRSDTPINVYRIHKEIFPEQKQQVIFYLIKKELLVQRDFLTTVVKNDSLEGFDVYIGANDLTELFLKQGGFTKEFEKEQNDRGEKERLERLQNEKLEAEVDIVKFQKGLGKRLKISAFIITVISVFASILTTFIQNRSNNNQESIDSLVIKSDTLTNRLLNIEKKLKELGDSIKQK